MIKLTSDARTLTPLSPYLIEFLPSAEAQARFLADYAVREQEVTSAMVISMKDARGQALANGFRDGAEAAGSRVAGVELYPTEAESVAPEVNRVMAAARTGAVAAPVQDALASQEQDAAQDEQNLEKVELAAAQMPEDERPGYEQKALFFAVSPDKIDLLAGQVRPMRMQAMLLGNSGWLNPAALDRQQDVTEGMYLVAPLLPQIAETSVVAQRYRSRTGWPMNEWAALGIDAAAFAELVLQKAASRDDVLRIVQEQDHFQGLAAATDFSRERENQRARVLKYENGRLHVIQ